ncbi:hypothetical protein COLO4_26417 [Corchorus olitorius]|uniref:TF-B3 domain-containing protein n=1 Tax=Corchorus olitorius TaxID=93759 RepID=A0A1R3HXJ2_9ROSI|nr:hypothetical protein COLO4_26417 [Corchorus olitorius]
MGLVWLGPGLGDVELSPRSREALGECQQQKLPDKFAKNIKKKLPGDVTLKGPSGIIWDVGLKADNDTLVFHHGWKNFVKDHSLVENDFLIFKYNGVSHFDVLMFDGESLCEKAASYFVRKCGHTETDSGCQTKRKMNETPVEVVHNSSPCGLESSPEKSTNIDIDTRTPKPPTTTAATNKKKKMGKAIPTAWGSKNLPKENEDVILRVNKHTWKTRYYYHRNRDCGGLSGGWRNFVADNNLKEDDVCVFQPADLGKKPVTLDVSIFRVLQAPLPLTQVLPDVSF